MTKLFFVLLHLFTASIFVTITLGTFKIWWFYPNVNDKIFLQLFLSLLICITFVFFIFLKKEIEKHLN